MGVVTWGMLEKNQDDPEKIEEAIARIIQEHNEDEAAHLDIGQSLQSHKASEIIDHLVASIIADKIREKEITVDKLLRDKQVIQPNFESLDGWGQSKIGVGADLQIAGGAVMLVTGDAVGDVTKIYLEGIAKAVGFDTDPWFQASVNFSTSVEFQDVAVGIGSAYPWSANDFFGFRWDKAQNKMYAYSYDDGVETKDEIVGYDAFLENTLRAEMSNNGTVVKYFVNDVLKITKTGLSIFMDSDIFLVIANKCQEADDNFELYVSDVIFVQDR